MTPWTAAGQASLSTTSLSLLTLMSTESVMPSNHLILCCPLLLLPSIFPSIRSFPMSQLFSLGGQSIGASASVLPVNNQSWFPLELTSWISLLSKGFSRVCSNTTVQKHHFFGFGIVNKTEVDVFLELSCFFKDPTDVGNLISGSSAFLKTNLNT